MNENKYQLICGDCIEIMRRMPEKSVDLMIADPPYNIKVITEKAGRKTSAEWDKIKDYEAFTRDWIGAARHVLKDNGVLYIWQTEIPYISKILDIAESEGFSFRSFLVWNKGKSYRYNVWGATSEDNRAPLRQWFNTCEYCLHFFSKETEQRQNDGAGYFQGLIDWYQAECSRLGLTEKDIGEKYTEVTGRKPYMLRHYFKSSQFEIPTEKIWNSVYVPLGFSNMHSDLAGETEKIKISDEYQRMKKEYSESRNYHKPDKDHNNVFSRKQIPTQKRFHTCEKPMDILERFISVSLRPGGVVLDPFAGSGSCGVAAIHKDVRYIGIEKDRKTFEIAKERMKVESDNMEIQMIPLF